MTVLLLSAQQRACHALLPAQSHLHAPAFSQWQGKGWTGWEKDLHTRRCVSGIYYLHLVCWHGP
jgi:hypothetical protein